MKSFYNVLRTNTKMDVILGLLCLTVGVYGQFGKYDCPLPWLGFQDSCYKFELYADTLQNARQDCENDGASLLSILRTEQHEFITGWLDQNDLQNNEWWTSGIRDSKDSGKWNWESDGTSVEGVQFWLNFESRNREGNRLLYGTDGATWGWVVGSEKIQEEDLKRPYICVTSKSNIYKILQEDRGFDYGTKETDPTRYQRGPHFIQQPQDVIYEPAGIQKYITLECIADSNPHSKYNWYITKEQVTSVIDPLTKNKYTVTDGQLTIQEPKSTEDNGNYHCIAGNKYGSILSNTVQLKFGFLLDFPKSTRDPVRVQSYAGIGIECNPPHSAYDTLLFSWYKDSIMNFIRPALKPYTFISSNGKLYFSSVTRDDIGDYYCVVSSPYTRFTFSEGKTSMPIKLEVIETTPDVREPELAAGFPTVFPSSPKQGDNIRMECFALGTDEMFYNWERVGAPMPSSAHMSDHNRVLNIPDVQIMHSGEYKCTVSRENGLSTSGIVQVPIEAAPFFTIPLKDQHVDQGADLTWRCIASGIPTVTYSWYRNATKLTMETLPEKDKPRYTILNNVLTITSIDPVADSAMYQCAATNSHGRRFSTAQLRVLSFPPNFSKYPLLARQYGTERGNVTILCEPEAAPAAQRTWKKNGAPLNAGTDSASRVYILPNGNLRITKLTKGDAGHYTCVAENLLGSAESSGNLTILSSTTITQAPREFVAQVNRTAFFHCEASYNPLLDITYDWYQNTYKIPFIIVKTIGQDKIYVQRDEHFKRGAGINRGGLYITHVGFEHAGEYTCTAKTTTDTISRSAELKVIGPPSQPAGVYGEATTAHSIVLTWGTANDNGRSVTAYTVEANNKGEDVWRRVKTNIKGQEMVARKVRIDGLEPWSSYEFRVRAQNVLGEGEPSDPSPTYTTLEALPKNAPLNVGGGGGKVGDLTITWDPVPRALQNGRNFGYRVKWKKAILTDEEWDYKEVKDAKAGRLVVLVGSTNFYSLYDVSVQVFNIMGDGPESDVVQIYSAEDIPSGLATNVRASQHNATALYIEWDPVPNTRENIKGVLLGYRINYWRTESEDEEMSIYRVVFGQRDGGLIIGLDPYTMYTINVQVINSAGNGPKSQDFWQRTLRSPPLYQPTEVHVYVNGYDSIMVKFRGVSTSIEEEPLEGYMVKIWRVGENLYVAKEYDAMKKSRLVIEGLDTDTHYLLRVYGYSRGGQGLMSSPAVQFILGSNCWVKEDSPDKDYVYRCRGETDSAPPSLRAQTLWVWLLLAVVKAVIL